MNTTGCDPAFARDSFFLTHGALDNPQCTLLLPLYYIPLVIYFLTLGTVAIIRTTLVLRNRKKRAQHYSALSSLVPWVIVSASWASFCIIFLEIIIPATFGTDNHVMSFIIGLQFLSFNILAERWFRKLVRLGSKIIAPHGRKRRGVDSGGGTGSGSDSTAEDKAMEYLSRTDSILKLLDATMIIGITVQFISLCVVGMIFPNDSTWTRVGIGLEGLLVWVAMTAIMWQYERCTIAISSTTKNINNVVVSNQGKRGVTAVQQKFRKHQLILFCIGVPGGLIYVLWGTAAVPISYVVVIINGLCDAGTNGGVLLTFIKRASHRRPSRTEAKSKTMLTTNNVLTPRSVYFPSEISEMRT